MIGQFLLKIIIILLVDLGYR